MQDIADKLREVGIVLDRFDPGEHATTCPQCSAARRKAKSRCLSVKIDTAGGATWICQHCGWTGNVPAAGFSSALPVKRNYRRPEPPAEEKRPDRVYEWFLKRAISPETVNAFRIYQTEAFFPETGDRRACMAFPYHRNGELISIKYRSRDDSGHKVFAQEKDCEPTLYNLDAIEADEVVIAEGEIDVMALWEVGFKSVTTLPGGSGRTNEKRLLPIKTEAHRLAKLTKVIVATDGDEAGQFLADDLIAAFGKDKCFTVKWPDGCKDANDVLVTLGREALVQVIADAKPFPMDGVFTVRDYWDSVMDLYYGRGPKPVSTGMAGLDPLFRIMPQSFNVITGIPNMGKSQFLDQMLIHLIEREGWNVAMYSPEYPGNRHIARLAQIFCGLPFDDGPMRRLDETQLREAMEWMEDKFLFIESGEVTPSLDYLLERFRWAALRKRVKATVIDPWNEVEPSRPKHMRDDEFISQGISKIKRFNRVHDCVNFTVVHPSKPQRGPDGKFPVPGLYDCNGGAMWNNKADAGVVVHRDFDADRTQIVIRKIREQPVGGTIGEHDMRYDLATRRYTAGPVANTSDVVAP